ncbi:ABC transporter permease [Methylophaga lonarensis]|uniref:ABC transporter permease n=1 Tax=Methylophaga lonarensis TaxID=999151 RepID=UPI003D292599
MLFKLAWKSLLERKVSMMLTVLMIAVSAFVLLSVETIRYQAKESFSQTVSGVDLIVGARTGQLNLLLYSVFHIGHPNNNISWQSYQDIASHQAVEWTIPLSLGDSHRGYRVIGTSDAFFEHFRYANRQSLKFADGRPFDDTFDVVIGAAVARQLGYELGRKIVLAHGIAAVSFSQHDDYPFEIVGILAPTGTPIDQSLFVSLDGIEAIHVNWQHGAPIPGSGRVDPDSVDLTPDSITAFMVGLTSRIQTFNVQRMVNDYRQEALMAILPGATLSELWRMLGSVENLLRLISMLVLTGALFGMCNMLLASMRERRYEMSVLRALGYGPWTVFSLLQLEALIMSVVAILVAVAGLHLAVHIMHDQLMVDYSLHLSGQLLNSELWQMIGLILVATFVVALLPAVSAYRHALHTNLGR